MGYAWLQSCSPVRLSDRCPVLLGSACADHRPEYLESRSTHKINSCVPKLPENCAGGGGEGVQNREPDNGDFLGRRHRRRQRFFDPATDRATFWTFRSKLVHCRLCPQNQCRSAGASGQAVPIQRRMLSRPQPCQDPGQLLHRCSAPTSLPRHYRGPSGQHRLQGRQHQHARRPSLHIRASAKHMSELQNAER